MAMHAYSAVPDTPADRAADVPTVATLFGRGGTLVRCGVAYALNMASIDLWPHDHTRQDPSDTS